jgi:hypothetical protein
MIQTLMTKPDKLPKRVRLPILFVTLPVVIVFLVIVRFIPPITGRIVDAVTGESIRNVRLTMEMSRYEGFSVNTELHDSSKSKTFGWFFLSGAVRWRGIPLPILRSYWLTVNEGNKISGQEEMSADNQTRYNPMFNRRGADVGDRKYFPLTVTFRGDGCDRIWAATCMYKPFWWGISLPLIPVLDDINECNRISDSRLRENCRQLNTYRAAFMHVDTYEQVEKGKELCAGVDHSKLSSDCLQQLALYVANPGYAYARSMKPAAIEPVPEGMFPDSVAGLPSMKDGHCNPQVLYDGRVTCGGGYGVRPKWLAAVYFERWPEGAKKPETWSHLTTPIAVTEEVHSNRNILRFDGKWYSGLQGADGKSVSYEHNSRSYVWCSGNTLVEILFYDPTPQQEEFLSYYLGKFPITSQ